MCINFFILLWNSSARRMPISKQWSHCFLFHRLVFLNVYIFMTENRSLVHQMNYNILLKLSFYRSIAISVSFFFCRNENIFFPSFVSIIEENNFCVFRRLNLIFFVGLLDYSLYDFWVYFFAMKMEHFGISEQN